MPRFAYENLGEDQFENLVVLICRKLFGVGVQPFAKGADGGRDARFIGAAELFPSSASPWRGTTIIQAKHTIGVNKHCGESDFFSEDSKSCVIAKEVPRITKLRKSGELDNYIIFANRRVSAGVDDKIRSHISSKCKVPKEKINLQGIEQLETSLRQFPEIIDQAKLDPIDSPLIIDPNQLAEVVLALGGRLSDPDFKIGNPPETRISYEDKNKINNTSAAYARNLRQKYLKDCGAVRTFLADPENQDILANYEAAVDEFNAKILSKRKDYQSFDEAIEHLIDLLINRDPILRQATNRRLTRVVVFYMYWNCDLGETERAEA